LWAAISSTGLAIDLVISACGAQITVPLQMSLAKKIFANFVFSVGIL